VRAEPHCPNGHAVPDIALWCPDCGEFVFVRLSHADGTRTGLRAPLAVLVVAGLTGLVLLRESTSAWPPYALLSLALVSVLVLVLSRGAALVPVTVVAAAAVASWILYDLLPEPLSGPAALAGVAIGWLAAVGFALLAGTVTFLPSIRARGTYLVVMTALVPGLWWSSAAAVDAGVRADLLFDLILLLGTVAPLVFLVVNLTRPGTEAPAALLGAVSIYLSTVHLLIRALEYFLAKLLPEASGETSSPWTTFLDWREVVVSAAALLGLSLLLSRSVARAARGFSAAAHDFLLPDLAESSQKLTRDHDPFSRVAEHLYQAALRIARTAYLVGLFVRAVLAGFAVAVSAVLGRIARAMLLTLQYLIAPVVLLSATSAVLLAVVRALADPGGPTAVPGGVALNTGLVCVGALILGLSCAALGLAPLTRGGTVVGGLQGTATLFVVTTLVAGAFWVFVSVASPALWLLFDALERLRLPAGAFAFGPALRANLVVVLSVLLTFVSFTWIVGRGTSPANRKKALLALAGVLFLAMGSSAVWLGSGTATAWVQSAFS
jgi:hypothetical protein